MTLLAVSTATVALFSAFFAFAGGVVSSYLIFKGNKLKAAVEHKSANNSQVETIFEGYSKIVEDLQHEVDRLKNVIDDLREEQDECEKRNAVLREELTELKTRILIIEQREAEHHGDK